MLTLFYRQFDARTPDENARNALAQSSWPKEACRLVPVGNEHLHRLFNENGRQLPFLKDVWDYGIKDVPDEDIAAFVLTDAGLSTDITFRIAMALQEEQVGEAFRQCLYKSRTTLPTDAEIREAPTDGGSEANPSFDKGGKGIWFFRAGWWRKHRKAFPDMLLPRACWDWCMNILMAETSRGPAIRLHGVCWHISHDRLFEDPSMFGNGYNIPLARKFFLTHNVKHLEHCIIPATWGWD